MKKVLVLVFVLCAVLIISPQHTQVFATPGVWSANVNSIYYNDGYIGIGTSAPTAKFHLNAGQNPDIETIVGKIGSIPGREWTISTGKYDHPKKGHYPLIISQPAPADCPLCLGDLQFKGGRNFNINMNGNVGIGTGTPTKKLSVDGTILTREIIVSNAGHYWPDYVFENDYSLMSLEDLDAFIKANKHLPNIPDEKQVLEEGVSLGEMQRLQMEKIEELTLYILQLEERITKLEGR